MGKTGARNEFVRHRCKICGEYIGLFYWKISKDPALDYRACSVTCKDVWELTGGMCSE